MRIPSRNAVNVEIIAIGFTTSWTSSGYVRVAANFSGNGRDSYS